jgi:hypothetical protein
MTYLEKIIMNKQTIFWSIVLILDVVVLAIDVITQHWLSAMFMIAAIIILGPPVIRDLRRVWRNKHGK